MLGVGGRVAGSTGTHRARGVVGDEGWVGFGSNGGNGADSFHRGSRGSGFVGYGGTLVRLAHFEVVHSYTLQWC